MYTNLIFLQNPNYLSAIKYENHCKLAQSV